MVLDGEEDESVAVLLEERLLGVALDVEVADEPGPVDGRVGADVDDRLDLLVDRVRRGELLLVDELGGLRDAVEVHLGECGSLDLGRGVLDGGRHDAKWERGGNE